jgi:hypothetical protein
MNHNEAMRIAAATNQLRPDWPVASLVTLLARPELANRPRRDVAVALTWVACDAESKTPARVLEAGPWWKAANGGEDVRPQHRPYDPRSTCHVCSLGPHDPDDHAFISVERARAVPSTPRPHEWVN